MQLWAIILSVPRLLQELPTRHVVADDLLRFQTDAANEGGGPGEAGALNGVKVFEIMSQIEN